MCRNIKTLYELTPNATDEDIKASATQYVRKLSGIRKPKLADQIVFDTAVDEIADATKRLLHNLTPSKPIKTH